MSKRKLVITDDSFKLYSKELNKLPRISSKREKEIIEQIKTGTVDNVTKKQLEDEIVKGYLRYVIHEASKLRYTGVDLVDLISEGNYGLMKAIQSFDYNSGNKFTTYAYYWIKAQMMACVYDTAKIIRLPHNVAQELHRQIKDLNETGKEISSEMANLPSTIDLYKHINTDDEDSSLVDVIKNTNADDIEKQISLKYTIDLLLNRCTEREQKVIKLLFGLDGVQKDMKDIALEMNLNVESIRNIQNKALNKMKLSF